MMRTHCAGRKTSLGSLEDILFFDIVVIITIKVTRANIAERDVILAMRK